jgi:hypothetical protein
MVITSVNFRFDIKVINRSTEFYIQGLKGKCISACNFKYRCTCTERKISQNNLRKFDVVRTVHHPTICIWHNKLYITLVTRIYFLLGILQILDYISLSSGATFISCKSHLLYAGTVRLAVVWLQLHNSQTYRHILVYGMYSL